MIYLCRAPVPENDDFDHDEWYRMLKDLWDRELPTRLLLLRAPPWHREMLLETVHKAVGLTDEALIH